MSLPKIYTELSGMTWRLAVYRRDSKIEVDTIGRQCVMHWSTRRIRWTVKSASELVSGTREKDVEKGRTNENGKEEFRLLLTTRETGPYVVRVLLLLKAQSAMINIWMKL